MNCDDCLERLSPFEAGELATDLAEQVQQHLAECAGCSRLLEALRRTGEWVDRLRDDQPPRSVCVRILAEADELLAPVLDEAPEIMTPEQLARFLRVPLADLADVIDTIPGFEIGDQLRFRRERVVEWINERERARARRSLYSGVRAV